MGRQRRIYQPVYYEFPRDFPDRLERFKEETGLTWNALARRLGVQPLPAEGVEAGDRPRFHQPFHPPDPGRKAGAQGDFDVS